MPNRFYRDPDFETLQLHAGQDPDGATNARAVPIYHTASYMFNSVEHAANLCALREQGHIYSRVGNPTTGVFEKRMAALEGGVAAVATSSGLSATALTVQALASSGDNIVTASRLYGGAYNQFKVTFKKFGIDVIFVPTMDVVDFEPAINEKTKALYVETIANSDNTLADIGAFAKATHKYGIPLIVDNTFGMGGYIVKPISLGADIIVHSATKWIGGHGTIIAGVIIDSGNFDWRTSNKFPSITGPSSAYGGISLGEVFHPYLDGHPRVNQVTYLGLPSHPSHQLALKTLRANTFGGILTFRLEGGARAK
ncbi:Cys/Met metabolism PLP-dependent enzyme-domain-containing protein [Mycena sp. CBHHK59/15]|nr:Cys/Met metabolism PLP-dependent enzyme-domain-containing protein [Mycena sp. CBHHK59/15]